MRPFFGEPYFSIQEAALRQNELLSLAVPDTPHEIKAGSDAENLEQPNTNRSGFSEIAGPVWVEFEQPICVFVCPCITCNGS